MGVSRSRLSKVEGHYSEKFLKKFVKSTKIEAKHTTRLLAFHE